MLPSLSSSTSMTFLSTISLVESSYTFCNDRQTTHKRTAVHVEQASPVKKRDGRTHERTSLLELLIAAKNLCLELKCRKLNKPGLSLAKLSANWKLGKTSF